MPNKIVTTSAGNLRESPAGQLMLGSIMQYETVPTGVSEAIPTNYQLIVYGSLDVSGTLDVLGKLVLL